MGVDLALIREEKIHFEEGPFLFLSAEICL
jgi:hypothetical protein